MGAVVLNPGIKSEQWAYDSDLVDPDWKWFPRDLKIWHATWEGGGAPRDLIGQNHGIFPATPPTWKGGLAGRTLEYNESDNYYTVADGPDLTLPLGNWTIAWYMRVPDNTGSLFQYFFSWGAFGANNSINVTFNEDSSSPGSPSVQGGMRANISDTTGLEIDVGSLAIAPFSDYKLIVLRKFAANEMRFYVDGKQSHAGYIAQETLTNAVNHTGPLNIGRRSDGDADRWFGGEISWWAKWDRDIGEPAIAQLDLDPDGPFRMADDPVFFVPVAPAGGRIMSSLAAHGGLAGLGGIAGEGGGLAG